MAECRESVVCALEDLEVLFFVAGRVIGHAARGEDMALRGEQTARLSRRLVIGVREYAVLEVMQGVFLCVAYSRLFDFRQ